MLPIAESVPSDPNSYQGIGWVLVAIGALAVIVNQFGEVFNRFRAKEPSPPLHKEYASREQHDELRERVDAMAQEIAANFKDMREERSRSARTLHERIEKFDIKNQQLTAALSKEVKEDFLGVHHRISEIVTAFSELKGAISTALKNSNNPFGK